MPVMNVKPSMAKEIKRPMSSFVRKTLETLEGWLKKKSPHIYQGWQTRYCKLQDRKFYYYKQKDLENPMGVLDFDMVSVIFTENKENNSFTFDFFCFL